MIAGGTGLASSLSWVEPLRPYLMGISVAVLGFAWYQRLKPQKSVGCVCDTKKKGFLQTKSFLVAVTIFSVVMMAYPYLSSRFYSETDKKIVVVDKNDIQKYTFDIEGMTCAACEKHVSHAVERLDGIVSIQTSYENGQAVVEFVEGQVSVDDIEKSIQSTGYTIKEKK